MASTNEAYFLLKASAIDDDDAVFQKVLDCLKNTNQKTKLAVPMKKKRRQELTAAERLLLQNTLKAIEEQIETIRTIIM